MRKRSYNKKGFISLFWVAIIMLLLAAVMITTTNMFAIHAPTSKTLLLQPAQRYYVAEFGLWNGKYVCDNYVGIGTPATVNITTVPIGTDNYSITITFTRLNPITSKVFDITSTATLNGTNLQWTVRAHYTNASGTGVLDVIY